MDACAFLMLSVLYYFKYCNNMTATMSLSKIKYAQKWKKLQTNILDFILNWFIIY